MHKAELDIDVMAAARERVAWVFDTFPKICVSFSAGKDSSVMLHLVAEEARRRGQRIGVMLIDLEAQYTATIEHGLAVVSEYADVIDLHWVALPLVLRNAVSQFEPRWVCWDPDARDAWVREPPDVATTDPERYPFYRHAMEFEEFVEEFGAWYGQGEPTAILVGIRAQESLNRFRTLISASKTTLDGKRWTTWKGAGVYNVYPIYDWKTEDIWRANGKMGWSYNAIYDRMHLAGLTIHQARICQPYGDDQRKGLWLFKVLEPETWSRVVARVLGANTGALYAHKHGGLFGRVKVNLPRGHTWQSFTALLLETMPPQSREHYEAKIATFIQWYRVRGVAQIPDDTDEQLAGRFPRNGGPSWRRIATVLIKNDWWCKGLSFSQTKSHAYENYLRVMRARRSKWGL